MQTQQTAVFSLVDDISSKLDAIAGSGLNMIDRLERAAEVANSLFDMIDSSGVTAARSADGVATSCQSVGNSLDELEQAVQTAAEAHDQLSEAMDADSEAAEALAKSDDVSAEAKEALTWASEGAAEAMNELTAAQENAAAAMEGYDSAIVSGTSDLDALEGAAQRAGRAVEELEKVTEQAAEGTEKGGKKGVEAVDGIASALAAAGITATVKEIAEAAYGLADAFSEAESTVVKATGASGEALDSLMESTMNAYAAAKSADLSNTASAIGEINTRMGLTGDELTIVTGQFLDFAEITGTNVVNSVQSATKIMNKWGIEAGDVESVLDKLAYAGQVSGISVSSLSDTVTNSSATFQALGMDLDNAISLLADLELYGTSSTTVVTGLRTAVNNFTSDGLDAEEALQRVIEQIANMEDASAATALAVETFGSRAGQDLAGAIRSGAISVDSLTNSLDVAKGTLTSTATTAQTLEQKWTQASNNISVAFSSVMEPALSGVSGGLAGVVDGVGTFLNDHPGVVKAIAVIGAGLGAVAVAIAGVSAAAGVYTAATAIATAVTTAFGTAFAAAFLPITAVVAGIAALATAVYFLVDAFSAAEDETAGMTATTRAQYYELQSLNEEYERACEQYGETSDEALRLQYQVDDLSAAFEANRQTVEEFTAEVDALCESVNAVSDSFNNALSEIDAQETGALALIRKYEDLATKIDRTDAEEAALEAVTKKLSASYPDLVEQLESASMSTDDYVEAMRRACEQQAEQQRLQQAQETYVDALEKQAQLEEEIAKATANVTAEQERLNNMSRWDRFWASEDDLKAYQAALDELTAAQMENEATIARIEQDWADAAAAAEAAADGVLTYEQAVSTAYESVRGEIEELCAAYDEAYQAALESFEGQFGLFDKAEADMDATVANAQAALDSQLAYWENYNSNIGALKATTAADLGLIDDELGTAQEKYEALMAYVQDGSEQAAGLAASMAEAINSGNTEAVSELANTISQISSAQQEAADLTADWTTGFYDELENLEQTMYNTVTEGLDLSDEAEATALETIESYAAAIRAGKGDAVSAATEVAKAVSLALSSSGTYSGSVTATAVEADAVGTTNSADVFIAGEDGPELIVGKAGSTVFPADETERIISAVTNNDNRITSYSLSPMDTSDGNEGGGSREQSKHITLEIAGGSPIEINGSGGASEEDIVEILVANLRPALLNIVKEEIFEEGDGSYEY